MPNAYNIQQVCVAAINSFYNLHTFPFHTHTKTNEHELKQTQNEERMCWCIILFKPFNTKEKFFPATGWHYEYKNESKIRMSRFLRRTIFGNSLHRGRLWIFLSDFQNDNSCLRQKSMRSHFFFFRSCFHNFFLQRNKMKFIRFRMKFLFWRFKCTNLDQW